MIPRSSKSSGIGRARNDGYEKGKVRGAADERERIALDLEHESNRLDQDAERYADERSPLLQAQAEALWDAAQRIRGGEQRPERGGAQ